MLMFCKSCGWVEQPKPVTNTSTATSGFLAGVKAAFWLLGGAITAIGYYIKAIGAFFVGFGWATWWLLGAGLVGVVLGWVLILLSRILVALGRALRPGDSGPSTCPSCGSDDLIPTKSPAAKKMMADLGVTAPEETEVNLPLGQRILSYGIGIMLAFGLVFGLPYWLFFSGTSNPKPSPTALPLRDAYVGPQATPTAAKFEPTPAPAENLVTTAKPREASANSPIKVATKMAEPKPDHVAMSPATITPVRDPEPPPPVARFSPMPKPAETQSNDPFAGGSFRVSGAFVHGTLRIAGGSATFMPDDGSAAENGSFHYNPNTKVATCEWRSGARLEIWVKSQSEKIGTWFARDLNNFRCSVTP